MGTSNDGMVKANRMVKATGMVKAPGMVETTGSTSTFVTNAGAGGAVEEMMLVWRVAMSRYSVWSRETRPSAEVQSSTRDQKNEKSVFVGETERGSQQRVLHIHRSRTKACLTSTSDAVCVDDSGKQQWWS